MKCAACGCWVEIEEPNPTDLGLFLCDDCLDAKEDAAEAMDNGRNTGGKK